jgi:hypothetical protein
MMNLRTRALRYAQPALISAVALLAAGSGATVGCNPTNTSQPAGGGGAGGNGGAGAATVTTTSDGQGGFGAFGVGGGVGGSVACDPGTPDDDSDGDGFSEVMGDCDDCDANKSPLAAEVIAEPNPDDPNAPLPDPADEDCDNKVDEQDTDLQPCDAGLAINSEDPMDAVKAIGFCDTDKNGAAKFIKKATWVLADGLPPGPSVDMAKFHLGHGLVDHFGANDKPREGAVMLALSSGTARNKEDAGFVSRNYNKGYSSNPPLTFSGESPACPGVVVPKTSVQDAAGLELEIDAPSNVLSLEFNFNFRSYEFPQFICTQFNDFFWANFVQGNVNKNVSFDNQDPPNPISVNAGFLSQCDCPPAGAGECIAPPFPQIGQPQKAFQCEAIDQLVGTDFDGFTNPQGQYAGWTNAGTGWLKTTVPVKPKELIKLRFVVFDSGVDMNGQKDHNVDSTVTIDKFKWHAIPGTNETVAE